MLLKYTSFYRRNYDCCSTMFSSTVSCMCKETIGDGVYCCMTSIFINIFDQIFEYLKR